MRARSAAALVSVVLLAAACETGSIGDGGGTELNDPNDPNAETCEAAGEPALRRLTAVELQNTIEDVFPEISASWSEVRLGPDPVSEAGFTNDGEMLSVNSQTAQGWLDTAEQVADAVTQSDVLPVLLPCSTAAADASCADTFISTYGKRLFRRPLGEEEKQRYAALHSSVQEQSDFSVATKWTLVGLMQSPHAVYRSEIGVAEGSQRVLTPYEIATALAYTYSGTTPSDELIAKAENGELDTAEQRIAEAHALLDTPEGRQNVHRFINEWIDYERIRGTSKDGVGDFVEASEHMVYETQAFVEEVLYEEDGGVDELLTANYTMLNEQLASYYGYGQGESGSYARVERPADWGVGLLAQGSVLAAHAHMDSSSPTLRGIMVYERILCKEMPPPPADIPPIDPPVPGEVTTRERYEVQHMQSDECRACHQYSDPTGFSFEHFDAAGRFRADEDGLTIDDSGSIPFSGGIETVDGQADLALALGESEEAQNCVSGLVATYAYGNMHDGQCAITEPQTRLASGEIGLVRYWAELAGTPHFGQRQAP